MKNLIEIAADVLGVIAFFGLLYIGLIFGTAWENGACCERGAVQYCND